MSKTKWTDERIAKEAALARVGSYNRTPVGWERMIEELLTQIRNDMQTEIDKRDAEIAYLREWLRGEVTMADVDIDIAMRRDGVEPSPRAEEQGE